MKKNNPEENHKKDTEEKKVAKPAEHEHAEKIEIKEDDKTAEMPIVDEAEKDATEPKQSKRANLWAWASSRKKITIPAAIILILLILAAIPFTRYKLGGLVLKQNFAVVVVDSQTGRPVSSAQVALKGATATTDGNGRATLRAAVGQGTVDVSKEYYNAVSQQVLVPIRKSSHATEVRLEATGRPVPITISNQLNRQIVAGATISFENIEAKTDDKGEATLVVPADKTEISASISAEGFNSAMVTLKVTSLPDDANKFSITPSGKIYFLSNQSGKLDVVKSDLDGQNRQTVVAGTGKEAKSETVLLATRDWKYLALQSRRDGGERAKLFLLDTTNDSLTVMDEGDAQFQLVGWEDHHFVYRVDRSRVPAWQPRREALKGYNADTKKLTTLDELGGVGTSDYDYIYDFISDVYVLNGSIVYSTGWNANRAILAKEATLKSVKPDGSSHKVLKTFAHERHAHYANPQTVRINPNELYIRFAGNGVRYYEYENDTVKEVPAMTDESYYNADYTAYLASPSGTKTFWSDSRDGKRVLTVGDADGKDGKQVAKLDPEYQTFGWFTDEYLLISKKGSELLIFPTSGVENTEQLFKITDYYRPGYSYPGYGGGYGGL